MTNLDTTSINTHAILTQPIHTLEKFYSVNRLEITVEDLLSDVPLVYFNPESELVRNLVYIPIFKDFFSEYKNTSAYTEAMLNISRYESFGSTKQLCEDICATLYARLSSNNHLALQVVESVSGSSEVLVRTHLIYKNFAVMCMITGCFTRALQYLKMSEAYDKYASERVIYEHKQNLCGNE